MNDTPNTVIGALPRECCLTCKFYMFDGGGMCRRNPPQVIVIQRRKDGEASYRSIFPPMAPSGWCGEYKEAPK